MKKIRFLLLFNIMGIINVISGEEVTLAQGVNDFSFSEESWASRKRILAFEKEYPLYLVDIGDADLAVRYKQGEGVPIVFIHGSWDDHHSWMPVAARLACSVRNPMLLYDRRGHSASTPDKEQGSVLQDVKDALLLLKDFNFSKVHFVGHSYGATIAVQLATEYPERVESLVLYEPLIFSLLKGISDYASMMNEVKTAMKTAKSLLKDGQIEEGTKLFVEKAAFGNGSWEAVFDERARATMTANYHTWLDQSNDPERLSIQPQKLHNFNGKITGITGTCSIPVYPAVVGELKKIVVNMQLRKIQGAGHGGITSHVAETVAIIEEHLGTDTCVVAAKNPLPTERE